MGILVVPGQSFGQEVVGGVVTAALRQSEETNEQEAEKMRSHRTNPQHLLLHDITNTSFPPHVSGSRFSAGGT